MIRVLVESPFSGDRKRNLDYMRRCMLDCFSRGEAPFASHLAYTQMLDDDNPAHRALGIDAGLLWGELADQTVVYTDLGISGGMQLGIDRAEKIGRPVFYRTLPDDLWSVELPDFPTGKP